MYIISGLLIQHTPTPTLQYHIHITSQSTCHLFFLSSFMFCSQFVSLSSLICCSQFSCATHSTTTLATSAIYIILQQLQQQQLQPTNPANATAARVLAVAGSFSTLALLLSACLRLAGLPNRCLNQSACIT